MATATERFSDKKVTQLINGNWVYTRGWDVVGFTDEDDAVSATGVVPGDTHPLNTYLVCTDIQLVENKLTLGRVRATYAISFLANCPVDPISRAPIITWGAIKNAQPIDTDMNGNPILNSAFDAFKGNVGRNFTSRTLRLEQYELYYDQSEADTYQDTVNNSGITFQGYDYDAGQVYCNYIQPAEPYQTTAPYVKIHYDFEIRTPNSSNLTALQIRHPFQLRILDQGLRGVYNDPDLGDTLGHFYLGDGHPVTRDVLLDGTGVPMDDGIKVTAGGLAAVTQTLPDSVLVDTTDNATFLIYMRYAETDFTGIT